MKRAILMAVVTVMTAVGASAQQKRPYGEFDLEVGAVFPRIHISVEDGPSNQYHTLGYIEGRWQLDDAPVDPGFHVGLSVYREEISHNKYKDHYRVFPVMALADRQFRRGKKVNPYAGLGFGVSETMDPMQWGKNDNFGWAFMPRAGVRFYNCVNLSLGAFLGVNDYVRPYCSLGVYF